MNEIYDQIGKTYDATRKADPRILEGLITHLGCTPGSHVLDVACGSGNYTIALHGQGYRLEGVDISEEMLTKARRKAPEIPWHAGDAARLPFRDGEFDGLTCILATHHMKDVDAAFREMHRVLRPGARLALFTSSPEQMNSFWLNHFLPGVVAVTGNTMLPYATLTDKLGKSGFSDIKRSLFHVDEHLTDFFLHCGKRRPELYLDPVVRDGISSFALYKDEEKLQQGLRALKHDLDSGHLAEVIRSYEAINQREGDFMHVSALKP